MGRELPTGMVRYRRVSLIPVGSGDGLLTEPIPAVQPSRREPLFMSHSQRFNKRAQVCVMAVTRELKLPVAAA